MLKLIAVAIKHVYVCVSGNAPHLAVGRELPNPQLDVGLVVAISGYPHGIVALDVRGCVEPAVHEGLTDIEYWPHARLFLHNLQPIPHAFPHIDRAAHLLHLRRQRFKVEHGRQVAFLEVAVRQEIPCLLRARGAMSEIVVCTYRVATLSGGRVVGVVVRVHQGRALGRLYKDERHLEVDVSTDVLFRQRPKMSDAQPVPVDGVELLAVYVLVF